MVRVDEPASGQRSRLGAAWRCRQNAPGPAVLGCTWSWPRDSGAGWGAAWRCRQNAPGPAVLGCTWSWPRGSGAGWEPAGRCRQNGPVAGVGRLELEPASGQRSRLGACWALPPKREVPVWCYAYSNLGHQRISPPDAAGSVRHHRSIAQHNFEVGQSETVPTANPHRPPSRRVEMVGHPGLAGIPASCHRGELAVTGERPECPLIPAKRIREKELERRLSCRLP